MSKQNPDVLDRLSSPSSSHRNPLLHKKVVLTPAVVRGRAGSSGILGHHVGGGGSLVKQMMNEKHRAPTSLVHLATRGKAFRTGVSVSPVVVKLSGVAMTHNIPSHSSSSSSSRAEGISTGNSASRDSGCSMSPNEMRPPVTVQDPCDKNVVLSALRQRR